MGLKGVCWASIAAGNKWGIGEDRAGVIRSASPGGCVPQFLKDKPCHVMKHNQVPWQMVHRAYMAPTPPFLQP